jgi:hypothetical protein
VILALPNRIRETLGGSFAFQSVVKLVDGLVRIGTFEETGRSFIGR